MSGPYDPEALFGQILDPGNVEQLKATGNELAHLKSEILAEEDKAALCILAYIAHSQLAQYKRGRLESMTDRITAEHDGAREKVSRMATSAGGAAAAANREVS